MKNNNTSPHLWLALRLTHFQLESLGVSRSHHNIMVTHKGRVCAATDNLMAQGIHLDMPGTTAQLLHKSDDDTPCRSYERETDTEEEALEKLCEQLYNYTPHIEVYRVATSESCEDIGLALEVSRCIKLFKGLEAIHQYISGVLADAGFSAATGQGHNKHMAWLLSYIPGFTLQPQANRNDYIEQLKPLSLNLLYQYPEAVEHLQKSGFFTFSDLIRHIEDQGIESLRHRLGENSCQHLTSILGIDNQLQQASLFSTPSKYYQPRQFFCQHLQFDYPVSDCAQLSEPIKKLLSKLSEYLVKKQLETQHFQWRLYDIYQNHQQIAVNIDRLYRDTQLACELTMIQLENQSLPFEVDTLELRCEKLLPINLSHQSFEQGKQNITQQALATITAKLHARLGDQAAFMLRPRDSHMPELSYKRVRPDQLEKNTLLEQAQSNQLDRPSWIFNCPKAIDTKHQSLSWKGPLEIIQGPERIEGLWWKKNTQRDYFVACRDDHVRLWIFYDHYKDLWFVHGVFA